MTTYYSLRDSKQSPKLVKGEKSRAFYNKDGIINCLQQPGQLSNQLQKSMRSKSFHL